MGYGSDDRYGDRWQGRDEGRDYGRDRSPHGRDGWNEGRRERMGWGPGGERERGRSGQDRGFFERAGEQVRSWFGGEDDDDGRPYRGDDRGYDRDGSGREGGSYGWMSGGWGNQAGESWNRDRPGVHEREGWFTDSVGGERGRRLGGGGLHDPHYSEWRRRQIEDLDRDYDEYRREHQSKFEQEFGGWRQKRAGQRQMLGKVAEHMEVVGSDGSHVGKVDKVSGDRIILAKSDSNAGGMHHSVPCGWVESVEDKVVLNRTAASAMDSWRNEDNGRALFERPHQGSEGPHALDRSFSGTYGGKNDD
jgi:hypothetical protein